MVSCICFRWWHAYHPSWPLLSEPTSDDRNDNGRSFGCRGCTSRGDHGHLSPHQIGGHPRQPIVLTLRPPVFDLDVMVLDEPSFAQALPKCSQRARERLGRATMHEPN